MDTQELANAIESLEKLSEASRTSEKRLLSACKTVAEFIEEACADGMLDTYFFKNYKVREKVANVGSAKYLIAIDYDEETGNEREHFLSGNGRYLYDDLRCFIPEPTRSVCLQFAKDVQAGLLEAFIRTLEAYERENNESAEALEGVDNERKKI